MDQEIKPFIKKTIKTDNRRSFILKIGVVIFFLIVGLVFSKPRSVNEKGDRPVVLGQETKKNDTVDLNNLKKETKKIVDYAVQTGEDFGGAVLGEANKLASEVASKSADAVSSFIIDNTVGNVVKQIDKLPEKQQEEIKKYICK